MRRWQARQAARAALEDFRGGVGEGIALNESDLPGNGQLRLLGTKYAYSLFVLPGIPAFGLKVWVHGGSWLVHGIQWTRHLILHHTL